MQKGFPTTIKSFNECAQVLLRTVLEETNIKLGANQIIPLTICKGESKQDLCFGCFPYAKELKTKPEDLAKKLAETLTGREFIESASSVGPFVNLRFKLPYFAAAAIGQYLLPQEKPNKNEHIVIEFSSPNTNKPQHLGHVRNNVIGDSTARILEFSGRKVTKVNLVNDRGIHICKSMLAYTLYGNGVTPETANKKGDHLVGDFYVKFDQEFNDEYAAFLKSEKGLETFEAWKTGAGKAEIEKNAKARAKALTLPEAKREAALKDIPEDFPLFKSKYKDLFFNNESKLGQQATDMLVKWEANDPEIRALWEKMNSWVFSGFKQTYETLGIHFDKYDFESQTYLLGKDIVEKSFNEGRLEKLPNGAIACDLEKLGLKGEGKKVLLRANGTSVYMTQDLGTAIQRKELYQPDKLVYVVASEQDRHFVVLFKILETIDSTFKDRCRHLSYGMVHLPTGRMKSREGTVVDADDLVRELEEELLKKTKEKWPELDEAELKLRSHRLAISALKYFILRFTPKSNVIFDKDKSIEFTGNTGPYLMYSYARTRSLQRKAGVTDEQLGFDLEPLKLLQTEEERQVVLSLYLFLGDVLTSADYYDSSKVADATFHIAKKFNELFQDKEKHPIVNCEQQDLKIARLLLTRAVGSAIKLGLHLLGIETLESM
jgi:arginyl-tRNA synthetase